MQCVCLNLKVLSAFSNTRVNEIFECNMSSTGIKKPTPNSERSLKERWIHIKYIDKSFFPIESEDEKFLSKQLIDAVCDGNILGVLKYILLGANLNYKSEDHRGKNAIQLAIIQKNILICDFLLLWPFDLNAQDDEGNTALHYAAKLDLVKYV